MRVDTAPNPPVSLAPVPQSASQSEISTNWRAVTAFGLLARLIPTGLLLPLAFVVIWESVARLGWVAAHLLPPPSALLQTAWSLLQDGALLKHIGVSSARVLAGFIQLAQRRAWH